MTSLRRSFRTCSLSTAGVIRGRRSMSSSTRAKVAQSSGDSVAAGRSGLFWRRATYRAIISILRIMTITGPCVLVAFFQSKRTGVEQTENRGRLESWKALS